MELPRRAEAYVRRRRLFVELPPADERFGRERCADVATTTVGQASSLTARGANTNDHAGGWKAMGVVVSRNRRWVRLAIVAMVLLGACGDDDSDGGAAAGGGPNASDWASVLADAKGQTVNWYMYGGSDDINRFVDSTYGPELDKLGIKLNRVPIQDTVDAVNKVLAEKQAGTTTGGAVDVIWINGENFKSLKDAAMLYSGWAQKIPNAKYVDWSNPAVNRDFGIPVDDDESPWSSAQFQLVYDSAKLKPEQLPRSYAALKEYACNNQGRVTYIAPGPGAFQGTRFVKGALFELSGDAKQWATFDQKLWDQWSPKLWEFFNSFKSCLYRGGASYAKDEAELHKLFANGEIDFTLTQAAVGPGALIEAGTVPKTAKAFVFDTNSIGDFNYLAIPSNASHQAAALVLANLILEPALQAKQILPANGFGLGYAIDVSKVSDAGQRKLLDESSSSLGDAAVPSAELAKALVGDAAAEYQDLVEQGWKKNIVGGL